MRLYQLKNKEEYETEILDGCQSHLVELHKLIPDTEKAFVVSGYSLSADAMVDFKVDFTFGEYPNVNWRERMVCPITNLNNRMRYADMVIDMFANLMASDDAYIMEQKTHFFNYLKSKYKNLIGSEYISPDIKPGKVTNEGIMHQDATNLSFDDDKFKAVMSFDVFEHIPDYRTALAESYRVLKGGGKLIFTAPFNVYSKETLIRANVNSNGEITHLMEPEYHGDPMSDKGILCYQHFGWDVIDLLLQIGFKDAYATVGWSLGLGFATPQIIFQAEK